VCCLKYDFSPVVLRRQSVHADHVKRPALLWIAAWSAWVGFVNVTSAQSELHPVELRCESAANPLGIDVAQPRLSWKLASQQRGQQQTAYQIQVFSHTNLVQNATPDLWDSGKRASDQLAHVEYDGKPLKSRQRVWWDVYLWDADGKPWASSEVAFFEMGLLDRADWSAQFIKSPLEGTGRLGAPAPLLQGV